MGMDWPWSTLSPKDLRSLMNADLQQWRESWIGTHPGDNDLWTDSSALSCTALDCPTDMNSGTAIDRTGFEEASLIYYWPRHGCWGMGHLPAAERLIQMQGLAGNLSWASWLQSPKRLLFPSTMVKQLAFQHIGEQGGIPWHFLMVDCPPGQQHKYSVMFRMRRSHSSAGWPAAVVYVEPGSWQDPQQKDYPGAWVSVYWRLGADPTEGRLIDRWVCTYSTYYNFWTHRQWVEDYGTAHPGTNERFPLVAPDGSVEGEVDYVRARMNSYEPSLGREAREHWDNAPPNFDVLCVKTILPPGIFGEKGTSTPQPFQEWEWEATARGTMLDMPAMGDAESQLMRAKFIDEYGLWGKHHLKNEGDFLFLPYVYEALALSDEHVVKANRFFCALNLYPTFLEITTALSLYAAYNNPIVEIKTVSRQRSKETLGRSGKAGGVRTKNLFLHPNFLQVIAKEKKKKKPTKVPPSGGTSTYKGTMPLQKVSGYRQRKWTLLDNVRDGDELALDAEERMSSSGKEMVQVWRDIAGGPGGKGFTRGNEEIQPKRMRIKTGVDDFDALTPTS